MLLFVFVLAAADPPPARPRPDSEAYTRASGALFECQTKAAARLDDGKVDAKTVARSVAAACAAELDQAIAVRLKDDGLDPASPQGAAKLQELKSVNNYDAAFAVLSARTVRTAQQRRAKRGLPPLPQP
jgi:hypothetical protein